MRTQDKNQIVELYETRDQHLASLLYATGQILDSTYWENGACHFMFEDKGRCDDVVTDYYKGLVKIDAKAIFEALRTIKGIIYGNR